VLALGVLTIVESAGGGAGGAVGGLAEGTLGLIGCGWSKMNPSAVVMVYQLYLNSGTVSGSPVRSQ
jgi:hypothetical protein